MSSGITRISSVELGYRITAAKTETAQLSNDLTQLKSNSSYVPTTFGSSVSQDTFNNMIENLSFDKVLTFTQIQTLKNLHTFMSNIIPTGQGVTGPGDLRGYITGYFNSPYITNTTPAPVINKDTPCVVSLSIDDLNKLALLSTTDTTYPYGNYLNVGNFAPFKTNITNFSAIMGHLFDDSNTNGTYTGNLTFLYGTVGIGSGTSKSVDMNVNIGGSLSSLLQALQSNPNP